jgi:hypothetical protein
MSKSAALSLQSHIPTLLICPELLQVGNVDAKAELQEFRTFRVLSLHGERRFISFFTGIGLKSVHDPQAHGVQTCPPSLYENVSTR